jgi:glutamyl-tRNA reductase
LFLTALECSKRVRSETTLGRRAVSVSSAALELARQELGSLHNKKVTILGAGKMAMLCLKHLVADAPSKPVELVNRSLDKAYTLIKSVTHTNARTDANNFSIKHELCANSDLVIVATSASEYLLKKQEFATACQSSGKSPLIIDIAVPRNVDPSIATISGIKLYTADDLASIVNTNLKERAALVEDAERIVFEVLDQFLSWKHSLDTVPTIQELRSTFERIRRDELVRVNGSVFSQEQEEELNRLTKSLINKLLHNPSARLKDKSLLQNCSSSTEMIERIFNLNPLYSNKDTADQNTTKRIDIPALPPANPIFPESTPEPSLSKTSASKTPPSACPVTQLVNAITSFKPAAHFVGKKS